MGTIATCGTDISNNSSEFIEGWSEEFNNVEGTYSGTRVIHVPWAQRYGVINNLFPPATTTGTDYELNASVNNGKQHPGKSEARAIIASIVPLKIGTPVKGTTQEINYVYARITVQYAIDPSRSDLDPFAGAAQLPGSGAAGAGIRAEYELDTQVETITLAGRTVKEVDKAKNLGDTGSVTIVRPIIRLTVRYPELRLARINTSLTLAGKINSTGITLGQGTINACNFSLGQIRYDGPRISTKVKFTQSRAIFDVTHNFSIAPTNWNFVPVGTDNGGVKYKNAKIYVEQDLRPLIYTFT